MEYKTTVLIIFNVIVSLTYIVYFVDSTRELFLSAGIKSLKNSYYKYLVVSLYIFSLLFYIIYLMFVFYSDFSAWIIAFASFVFVNSSKVVYNKKKI